MITPAYALTATERVLPRMALDFTTGVLDSRVTVTRALNTATAINSSGFIAIVNANLPRFDYDPTTLAPKGLLIEEARTNLALYSQDFTNALWASLTGGTGVARVATANAGISPDGTNNATRLQLDCTDASNSANRSGVRQPIVILNTTAYANSVYVKAYNAGNVGKTLRIVMEGVAVAPTVTLTSSWQRVIFTGTSNTVSGAFVVECRGTFTTQTADFLIYGAQLEAGAFATSYIPTTTLAVLRNADVVAMTGTNFSDWYNSTQGTFSAQYSVGTISTFVFSAVNSATPTTEVMYLRYVGNQHQGITVTGGATVSTIFDGTGLNVVNNVKTAFAYKASAYGIRTNGGALANASANSASGALPSGINKLVIGANQTGTGAFINGCIAKLSYYNISLLNAELSAVSK